MAVILAMASHDERFAYSGGAAGDQNGNEVFTRTWYDRPWDVVIRPKSTEVAEKIARAMEQACANNNIGYDQSQRTTLYFKALEVGWNLSAIMTPCECDCSSLVAVAVNAAGVRVSKDLWTGNMKAALMATGQFYTFSSTEYTKRTDLLMRGDILLNELHHVAVVIKSDLTAGAGIVKSVTPYAVIVTASNYLQCRTEPSSAGGTATEYKVYGQSKRALKNECIAIWKEATDEKGQKWGAINAVTPLCWVNLAYTKR